MTQRPAIQRIEHLLPRVVTPGQYLGGEWNQRAPKADRVAVRTSIIIGMPVPYARGIDDPTMQAVYAIVNDRPDAEAERVFLPLGDMQSAMRAESIPLATLESARPVAEFDWLVIPVGGPTGIPISGSGPTEGPGPLDWPGIVRLLDIAGIPIRASDRDDSSPLVIAVGPGARTPEPLAAFFDLLLPGEPDDELDLWLDVAASRASGTRAEHMAAITDTLPSAYAPSQWTERENPNDGVCPADGPHRRIAMPWVGDLDRAPVATSPVVGFVQSANPAVRVEIVRGVADEDAGDLAPERCAPLRCRDAANAARLVDRIHDATGFERIHLAGENLTRYAQLVPLLEAIHENHEAKCTAISLDPIPVTASTREVIGALGRFERAALTLDLAAASERLRDAIGRPAINKDIHDLVAEAARVGLPRLELRFRIGVPGETTADLDALAGLVSECVAIARRHDPPLRLHVDVRIFAPLPFTSDENAPMLTHEALAAAIDHVRGAAGADASKITFEDPLAALVRIALVRGNRRVADLIEAASRAGATGSIEDDSTREAWQKALASLGATPDELVAETLGGRASTSWSHLSWASGHAPAAGSRATHESLSGSSA